MRITVMERHDQEELDGTKNVAIASEDAERDESHKFAW